MIALYGCGKLLQQMISLGLDRRIEIKHVIDSNPSKQGDRIKEQYVISGPSVLEQYSQEDAVCIMSGEFEAQILQIIKQIAPNVRVIPYGHVVLWIQGCLVGNDARISDIEISLSPITKMAHMMQAWDVTYSQNAEDVVFEWMYDKKEGLYVDVGAHHPMRYSNTYRLFLKGWRGINIDPLPDCKELFDLYRPNDVNLNVAIGPSDNGESLQYYCFERSTFNTMNRDRVEEIQKQGWTTLQSIKKVPVMTLLSVFEKYVKDSSIDLLTIDVESMEIQVLETNNWGRYRPRFIIMEVLGSIGVTLNELSRFELIEYMHAIQYEPVNKVGHALFFMDMTYM